jgi:ribosomal protein S18 acetylase RimI-like enzyme
MKRNLRIFEPSNQKDITEIKKLFNEYAESLNFDLCFQGFDEELASLPGKYAPPDGFILLAEQDAKIAGCIALRKLDEGTCEMKRLFVRPEFRGLKIGKKLCDELITRAKLMGYKKMRLDTIKEQMKDAIKLYKSYGFIEIPPYYYNPQKGVIFMELSL